MKIESRALMPNVLVLAIIGAALAIALASLGGGSVSDAAPIAGTLVGAYATTMFRLTAPPPDPTVSALAVGSILNGSAADAPGPATGVVLWLAIVGGIAVGVLAVLMPQSTVVTTVAGGYVGAVATTMGRLTEPPPDPQVPLSALKEVLAARAGAPAGTGS